MIDYIVWWSVQWKLRAASMTFDWFKLNAVTKYVTLSTSGHRGASLSAGYLLSTILSHCFASPCMPLGHRKTHKQQPNDFASHKLATSLSQRPNRESQKTIIHLVTPFVYPKIQDCFFIKAGPWIALGFFFWTNVKLAAITDDSTHTHTHFRTLFCGWCDEWYEVSILCVPKVHLDYLSYATFKMMFLFILFFRFLEIFVFQNKQKLTVMFICCL